MARRGFSVSAPKWETVLAPFAEDMAKAATASMDEVSEGLKRELRAQVHDAGMGGRLANTWRGRRYPAGKPSLGPAAFVFSKSPEIIDAFDRGAIIHTVNGGKYIAIPTANVPRVKGQGRGASHRMTPFEVETYFNQDLKFAHTGRGRLIAFIDVKGSRTGGIRRATGKQLGRYYRGGKAPPLHAQMVMFILTPTARMTKRLDVDSAARHWANQLVPILDRNFSGH